MATVNLGRIKPVFKGTWSNSTAYTVDDFVVHSNECYIAIQAGSNQNPASASSYWTKIAAKGTDGTDLGTTLTTQGDLLYRDGSGLQRLAIGSANQALLVNSSANGFTYGSAGKAVECFVYADENVGSIASGTDYVSWNFTPTISGKVYLSHSGASRMSSATHQYIEYYFNNGSGEVKQHTHGAGYPPSSHTHNQGFGFSGFATTNNNADSSTIMLATANTQCNFRVRSSSGDNANAAGDEGKDHIVSAIIFES
jgi:hypothetical protein